MANARTWALTSCCGALVAARSAHAQEPAQAGPAAEGGDIVVTAQRRKRSLTDVGISASVPGTATVAPRRATKAADLPRWWQVIAPIRG